MKLETYKRDDYISDLEAKARRCRYDLNTSNSDVIVLVPKDDLMPIIYGYYQEDEEYFWYSPEVQFPDTIDEDSLDGRSYHYYLDECIYSTGYLADYMLDNKCEKD